MSPMPADLPPALHLTVSADPGSGFALAPGKGKGQRWTTYRVHPGDTLYDLADRYDTTVRALAVRNDIGNGRWLRAGEVIEVPDRGSPQQSTATGKGNGEGKGKESPSRPTSSSRTVTVRPGDTLSHLALRYDVSVASLQRANGLRAGEHIHPGQRLRISGTSAAASSGTTGSTPTSSASRSVRVRAGDTLSHIAARHDVSLDRLLRANPGILSRHLWVGQRVALPGGRAGAGTGGTTADRTPSRTPSARTASDLRVSSSVSVNRQALASVDVPSRSTIRSMVVSTAKRHGVDPALMLAISQTESGWNHRSVSYVNAIGTMQVIPTSGDWASSMVGRRLNLMDPQDNITAGTVIMRSNLRAADSESQAIAAYYQGLYGVQRYGMYSDTKHYVAVVRSARKAF